jgi:hypothetical protein
VTIFARTTTMLDTALAAFLYRRLGLRLSAHGIVDLREVLEVVGYHVLRPEVAGMDAGQVLLHGPHPLAVGGVLVDHQCISKTNKGSSDA